MRLTHTLFGHTGRVFRGKLIRTDNVTNLAVALTAGEDQNLCLWNLATGQLLHRHPLGAALWHIDYDPVDRIVYASGADGNCKQLPIGDILDGSVIQTLPIDSIPDPMCAEYPAKVRFLSGGQVAIVTNRNRLTCYSHRIWTQPQQVPFKVSVLETHQSLIAVAGHRLLFVYEFGSATNMLKLIYNDEVLNQMIRSVHFLSAGEWLVCDDNQNAAIVEGDRKIAFLLPTKKEPWATAALKTTSGMLLIGDRSGHLHLFGPNGDHRNTVRHLHGRKGCTNIHEEPSDDPIARTTIVTSGHDGTIKYIEMNMATKQLRLLRTNNTPIAWIQCVISHLDLVAGFNATKFVVWNRNHRAIVTEIECGGGHRYADLHCSGDNADFAFLRNKSLHWMRFKMPNSRRLVHAEKNWHSMSCTTVATMTIVKHAAHLVLSGGDDNLLKIHWFDLTTGDLHHLEDIFTHVSSLKCLLVQTLQVGSAWRIFSAGGRAQICVAEVQLSDPAVRKVRVTEVTQFMLHMSDAQRKRVGTANEIDVDAETRFMSMTMSGDEDLLVACSDGFIRHFAWTGGQIVPKSALFYGKCVLKVQIMAGFLVSAATDGNICFWTWTGEVLDPESKPVAKIGHHESGVQSWDWAECGGNEYQVVTGGDDERVVLSWIEVIEGGSGVRVVRTERMEDVHTAQVNGVRFAEDALYTTGADQTIFHWDRRGKEPRKVGRSCVADIKGVSVIANEEQETVIVYGHGVQTFRDNRRK